MATKDEIAALDAAYGKAVANRDADAIAALYTADAYFLPPNEPMAIGPAGVRAVAQSYLDAGAQSLELEAIALDDQGDTVIEVGKYTLGMQTPDGSMTDVGKYVQVMKRQPDGSLKIAYDCFNSDAPAG